MILVNMRYGQKILVFWLYIALVYGKTRREKKVERLLDKIGESIAKEAAGLTKELAKEVKREKGVRLPPAPSALPRHHHRDENGLRDEEPPDADDTTESEESMRIELQKGIAEAFGSEAQAQDDLSKLRFQVGQDGEKESNNDDEDNDDEDEEDEDENDEEEGGETKIELKITKRKEKKGQEKELQTDLEEKKDALLDLLDDDTDRQDDDDDDSSTEIFRSESSAESEDVTGGTKGGRKTPKKLKSTHDDVDSASDDDTFSDEETRRTIEDGLTSSVASKRGHPKKPKLLISKLTYRNIQPSPLKSALSAHQGKASTGSEEEEKDYEDDEIGDLRLKPSIEDQVEEPTGDKIDLIKSSEDENITDAVTDFGSDKALGANSSGANPRVAVLEPIPPKLTPTVNPQAATTPFVFTLPRRDDTSLDRPRRKHGKTRYGKHSDDLSSALEQVGGRKRSGTSQVSGKKGGQRRRPQAEDEEEETQHKLKTALRRVNKPGPHQRVGKTVRKELSHELSKGSFPKPGRNVLAVEGMNDKDEDYTKPGSEPAYSRVQVGSSGKIHGEALDDLDVREDVPSLEQPEDNSPVVTKRKQGHETDKRTLSVDEKLNRERKRLQEKENRLVNKLSLLEWKKRKLEHQKKRWRRQSQLQNNGKRHEAKELFRNVRDGTNFDQNTWHRLEKKQRRDALAQQTQDHVRSSRTHRSGEGRRRLAKSPKKHAAP